MDGWMTLRLTRTCMNAYLSVLRWKKNPSVQKRADRRRIEFTHKKKDCLNMQKCTTTTHLSVRKVSSRQQ